MNHERNNHECTERERFERLEDGVSAVRSMVVGKPPEENNGLRKDVRSIADSLREFRAENRFLKLGIAALLVMKTPDFIDLVAGFLKKGLH